MPLMPKRVKYRKVQRGNRKGQANAGNELNFGDYGLKALGRGWIKASQIEACRVAINRHLKRKGRLWVRLFPDKPVTKKPLEVRMGKGKGDPEFWVAVVRPGLVMFELSGVTEAIARDSMRLAASKLPTRSCFITRRQASRG
ncbi:MAG: 50S ribosomal protein L16 [Lentisphaerales bacterium]|jgi:large subunit ribosomal protein L16|nr:MAG: 50S ribosomal protein L16 [Lentisphaerales bacterium]